MWLTNIQPDSRVSSGNRRSQVDTFLILLGSWNTSAGRILPPQLEFKSSWDAKDTAPRKQ